MIEYYISKFLKKIRGRAIINSSIHKKSKINAGSHIVNSSFDKYSYCGYDCDINYTNVGSFCSISSNVKIGGGVHPMGWVSTSPVFYKGKQSLKAKFSPKDRTKPKRVIIGHDVWIGQNVLISQGVNIGTGSIIGMGSIVTKDIPPYSIYAGNPAKFIRKRFDRNISDKLLEIEWWNFSEEKILDLAKYINHPLDFINEANK